MPSYTYKNIQDRIADELNRTDLTAQIKKSIISAVEHYERERFWFNEVIDTSLTMTIGQNYLSGSVISSMAVIDKVQITVGTAKYDLLAIPYDEWADKAATSTTSGQPTEFSYYQDRVYLFPTPGTAYAVTLSGVQRPTTLSGDGDTNGFTNYCEELIRQRAKADLRINVILDEKSIAEASQLGAGGLPFLSGLERAAYLNTERERDTRATTGRMRGSGW